MKKLVLSILVFALAAMPALSQEQMGSIQGKVTTTDGKAIVNASVTVTSPNLIRPLNTTSDDKGRFRFPRLPIGEYQVTVKAEQYKIYELKDIIVRIGSTITVNPVMEVGAFEDVLTITGDTPIIDVKSTDVGEIITQELISKLPTPRFPTDMFAMTAANVGGDSVTMGGGEWSNAYKLDGIDVSDPQTHTVWVFVNMESIEEMEVLPIAGATADVGGFTGAAMNMVTKSGGNDFSGGFSYYYFDDGFLQRNTDDLYAYDNTLRESKNNDLTVFLGGPVMKDRIWFFGDIGHRTRERIWGEDKESPSTYEYRNGLIKLTSMLTDTMTLNGTFHYDNYLRERRGAAYNKADDATLDQEGPNTSFMADYVWAVDEDNMVEVKFTGWDGYFALLNRGSGPQYYDRTNNWIYGSSGYDYRTDRQRIQVNGTYIRYIEDVAGNHDLKFGYEWQRGKAIEHDQWDQIQIVDGEFTWRNVWEPDYYYEAQVVTNTLYVTDSWAVNDRLNVNLGVRYERPSFESPDSTLPSGENVPGNGTIHTFSSLAPRFGFTYSLDEDGTMVVRGSVGRYFESITAGVLDSFCPNPAYESWYYWDGGDWVLDETYPLGADTSVYTIDNNLEQMYTDAITVGVDYEITPGIVVGADYVWRSTQNFIVQVEDGYTWTPVSAEFEGTTYNVFSRSGDAHYTITNSPDELYYDFSGLILRATKRYSDNWQLQASLTISEMKGNAEDLYGYSDGHVLGTLDYYQDPNNQINRDGLLWGHRPINLKVNGTYTLPYEISVSGIASFLSGLRWTPLLYLESDDLNQGYVEIMAEPRGSRTLDDTFRLDVRIDKTFRYDRYTAQVLLDIYNVFNSGTYNDVQNWMDLSDFGTYLSVMEGRRFQIGARFSF